MQTRTRTGQRNQERFSSIPPTRVPRSAFDRGYTHKTTMNAGYLIPLHHDEILPGDTYNFSPDFFVRLSNSAVQKPYMDGLHFDWQAFFCPARLLWDNFTKMMGEKEDPDDHNDYEVPQMISDGYSENSLEDYLGLPITETAFRHHCLLHRMYYLTWNEWYRDQNLQDSLTVPKDDGPDLPSEYTLQRRGKRKDYISGALPFAQRGTPVELPLGTSAPVVPDGLVVKLNEVGGTSNVNWQSFGGAGFQSSAAWTAAPANIKFANQTGLEVDLTSATAATINEIRNALAIQHVFERDARGGGRYREVVLNHFGVNTDDIRLMRPELLGTGSFTIDPHPVAQTVDDTTNNQPLGSLSAFAVGASNGRGFTKSFTEHGYILVLGSVRAELTWQRNVERSWLRKTRFDYYWPDLANLGEQPIYRQEVYCDGTGVEADNTGDWEVWGYTPRYEDYRSRLSRVTGEFRSDASEPLDVYHLAVDFNDSAPSLNSTFVQENPPIERIVAIQDKPQFLVDCKFNVTHVRPMPKFGTPGMLRF